MKKLAVLLLCAVCFLSSACADSIKPTTIEKLPTKAQTFIKQYFDGAKISLCNRKIDGLEITYNIIFADASKVEFSHKGEWIEVDCNMVALPKGIVPEPIDNYVKSHYPNVTINKIERDNKEFEIKLSNRLELTFNSKMELIDIDD